MLLLMISRTRESRLTCNGHMHITSSSHEIWTTHLFRRQNGNEILINYPGFFFNFLWISFPLQLLAGLPEQYVLVTVLRFQKFSKYLLSHWKKFFLHPRLFEKKRKLTSVFHQSVERQAPRCYFFVRRSEIKDPTFLYTQGSTNKSHFSSTNGTSAF